MAVIEGGVPITDETRLGLDGRDEEIAEFKRFRRTAGRLDSPVVAHDWMAGIRWAHTNHELFGFGRETIDHLAAETDELALMTVELDGRAMTIYSNWNHQAVSIDFHLGVRLPMHCTATGKAMLAVLDESRVEEIITQHGLPALTDNTITSRGELEAELERIRDEKVAFEDEERIQGTRGVAAPIRNRTTGTLFGAIAVAGPTTRIDADRFETDLASLIRKNADMIEVNLTYS